MKRVISGLLLGPAVILIVLYAPLYWFAAVAVIVAILGLLEYNRMVLGDATPFPGVLWALPGAFVPALSLAANIRILFLYILVVSVLLFGATLFMPGGVERARRDILLRVLGVVYVGLLLAHFVMLRETEGGRWWLLFTFAVIWLSDTCAYYGGRLTGRHKLAPRISPGKTIEGALWGIAGAAVVSFIFINIFPIDLGASGSKAAAIAVIFAVILAIVGIVGDLAESLIKRRTGFKDSGAIIPGHGGVLDRMDSLLFAVPVMFYLLRWRDLISL